MVILIIHIYYYYYIYYDYILLLNDFVYSFLVIFDITIGVDYDYYF